MIYLNKKITIWILFVVLGFYACNNTNKIILVDNGVSEYEILTRDKADKKEKDAALELQNYLEKITTVKIPVVNENKQDKKKNKIFVKKLDVDKDEIIIRTEGENLVIGGGSAEATKNAVYVFLEKYLHCKWYTPNVEDIPNLKSIRLDKNLQYAYKPDITTRTVHSRLFYENSAFADKLKVTTEAFPNYVPTAKVHSFRKFLPEEKYFKEHPEYFALRNGKRIPTQPCLTNEAVYNIVRDSVRSFFKQFPDAKVISVSQNDNQQYCEDNNCMKIDEVEGGPAGTMIRFVNRIAAEFPDKTISTLAYQYTRKPSKTKPAKNVLITLCSIECDRSAPITENCTDFADDIRGWNALTDNIRIWDYTTQFTNFLAPFPNTHTLQPNIQFFRDNHAKWVFEQHSNNPSELFELRSYLMAKLLWNPDENVDALITEFTNGYYQEAGIYIKKYIDLIHKRLKEDPDFFLFLYGDPSQAFASYLSSKLLGIYSGFFDEAEKAVAQKPEVLQRVKEARLGIDFSVLEAARKYLSKHYALTIDDVNGKKIVNPFIVQKLDNFYRTTKKANITLMNEMRFTVNDYVKNYKNSLLVATKPNKAKGKKVTLLTKPKKYAKEDSQVLTDGALGGNSFYANWLGFDGNNMEVIIDLGSIQKISSISTAFLQVTNHVVFFPLSVTYAYAKDGKRFTQLGQVKNDKPLVKTSKVNDIRYFDLNFLEVEARYIKVVGENMKTPPYWHHAAGQTSWIFADEVLIN